MTTDFTSRIAPGSVFVDGRIIEFALRAPTAGCAIVQLIDLFPPGDDRATFAFALGSETATMPTAQLREFAEAAILRRAAAFVRGGDEETIIIPERIGAWPLGISAAEVAAYNRAMAAAEPVTNPNVIDLEERRRARRAS